MTAYPLKALVDYEDGERRILSIEEPSDTDAEAGANCVLFLTSADSTARVGLSPEATKALAEALLEVACRDEGEDEDEDEVKRKLADADKAIELQDAALSRIRSALAELPAVEPYPDDGTTDPHELSLRAGGRVVPMDEQIRRLRVELESVRLALAGVYPDGTSLAARIERLRMEARSSAEALWNSDPNLPRFP